MSRLNLTLAVIAVLQLVLLAVFRWTGDDDVAGDGSDSRAGQKPLQTLAVENIGRLEVTDGDGKTVTLARDGEGKWTLQSTGGYPVRETQAEKAVTDLTGLTIGRVVTRKSGNFVKLSVADSKFDRRVKVFDRSDKQVTDFYVGEGKKFDTIVYREAGKNVAYHATGLSTFDLNADDGSWVETRFTEWEEADVKSVKLENEKGTFELARVEEKAPVDPPMDTEPKDDTEPKEEEPTQPVWAITLPADAKVDLDETKVGSFVGGYGRMYLGSPVGALAQADTAATGLDKPAATATITMKDGTVHTLKLGAKKGDEDEYHVVKSGFDFVVTLRGYAVDNHFKKALADLAKDPPEEVGPPK